jgi:chorismate mutase
MEEKKIKKEYSEKIELMRKEIDIIDNELMNNFSKRFEIVEKIGNLKKDFSVPALQKAR